MTDKPIPAKILLALADNKATGKEFIGLSGSLYRHHLIFSAPQELRRSRNTLELTVIFRDHNSFKSWYEDREIKEFWHSKFDEFLEGKPKTIQEQDVIIEVDDVKNCVCSKSDFYILQGRSMQFMDELTCNNCLGQISYSKVPLDIALEAWQTNYERVYLSWLESGIFEEEAYKELTNYTKGKLNREGAKIRRQLSDFFHIPVYINYFVEDPDEHHSCLVCGQQGMDTGLKRLNKICKTCNTIFGDGGK